jgi:transglutaminase-like putative cysteine protease
MNDRGYIDQGEEQFRRAHALEPGDVYTLGWLAHFDRLRGRWGDAIRMRDRAREVHPEEGVLVVDAADTRREAGRRGEAKQLYGSVLEYDPDWARPWERLASMAFEDGDTEGAVAAWRNALERNPDDSLLAERIDFYQTGDGDGFRELMPSDDEIESAIAEVEEMTPHPGAHMIWALDDEVTVVRQDGSAQRMVTQVMKALTTDGRDSMIRQEVPPNARIFSAYVRAPDGTRQEASSIRGGTVRFRRLDVGSTVVLSYVYDSQPRRFLPNHFVSDWWFSGFHRQVRRARWVILLPPHRALATRILGDIAHEESQHGEMTMHTFVAEDIEPFVPEPGMFPANDLLWHVSVSTLQSWDEYVAWERALLSEVFRGDAQLAQLAARLTEGVTEPREKFNRLYRFVAQEIRYQQDYESSIAGVRPHSCPIVLERGYGDCKDKAVLLIRLAQEVDLDVRFAILRTRPRGRVEREVPNQQFNHAIVYVPAQEGIEDGFFMDPTTDGLDMGNLRQDDQGATSLVLDPQTDTWEFREIPYQSPDLRYTRYEIDVNVAGRDAATAEVTLRARGDHAGALRRSMRNEEEATIVYQNLATRLFDGSRVEESNVEHADDIVSPLAITLNLNISDSISPEGDSQRIQVPQITPLRGMTRLERRRTPMYLGPPFSRNLEITFRLPAGARIVRVPDDVDVEHECFEVSQHTRRRGRTVTVNTRYEQRCPEVTVEQYPEYRQKAQRAAAALESAVVFTAR